MRPVLPAAPSLPVTVIIRPMKAADQAHLDVHFACSDASWLPDHRVLTRRYGVDVGAEPITRPTGNLPGLTHALTSFVGRSDAVDKVAGLLD